MYLIRTFLFHPTPVTTPSFPVEPLVSNTKRTSLILDKNNLDFMSRDY